MIEKGRGKIGKWKITPSESESWDSYEWLLRQKMDSLEHLIREFSNDVRIVAGPRRKEEIDALVSALVTDLWCNVAQVATAKVKAELGELRTFDTSNVFGGSGEILLSNNDHKLTPELFKEQLKAGKTRNEIAKMCGVKPGSLAGYLSSWRRKGLID
jgi:hypothetical protein